MQDFLRKHFEKIIKLSDDEFAFVLSHFTEKFLRKGDFLIRESEQNVPNYFIVSGLTKLSAKDSNNTEHVVTFAMEDWWETDSDAFFRQTPATMQVQCLEDTAVFCLTFPNYRKLCDALPKMQHFFLEKSIASHIAGQKRILALTTMTAKERFEQLLAQRPILFRRLPKSLLASYLGVTRETLSRLSS
ncbi:Crp/Fnr family transcriptional regulator [Flavobacterium sp.]|uniref:Crp/Fnr family transcriptional regulator n=1 Tax=Flavobacterium sp. TaxID=239 RepID=UPI0011FDF14C|nr:Crp/Fnr family transcriptional regulator [Flavobacterium sp.]RZJ69712.1 MAG: Crp/Fnr family transcriptional regulator [Flavobacterium sp.]